MQGFGAGGYFWKEPTVFKKNPTFEAGAHFPDNQYATFGTPLPATADGSIASNGSSMIIDGVTGTLFFRKTGTDIIGITAGQAYTPDGVYRASGSGGFVADYGERYTGTNYERNLISGSELWSHNSVNKTTQNPSQKIYVDNYVRAFGTSGYTVDSGIWYDAIDLRIRTISGDIFLEPGGGFFVKFGTYAAIVAETLQGYITIQDAAGNPRKLAVVA